MSDELSRLEAMVADTDHQTSDLSPNDVEAICWAIARIKKLDRENQAWVRRAKIRQGEDDA